MYSVEQVAFQYQHSQIFSDSIIPSKQLFFKTFVCCHSKVNLTVAH